MRFDGPTLAHAWLAVVNAAGTDKKNDPVQLYKTVAIEEHLDGIRLVATDRRLLLTAWVPDLEHEAYPAPSFDEAPERLVICSDYDGRARSLLGYVLALQARLPEDERDNPGEIELALRFDAKLPAGMSGDDDTLDGMDPTFTVLDVPDVERVYLGVVEADYPDWRGVVSGFAGRKADRVAMSPDVLERLTKVRQHAEGPLCWVFGGRERAARVEYPDSDPFISGVFMPRKLSVPGVHDDEDPPEGPDDCPVCDDDGPCLRHATGLVSVSDLAHTADDEDPDG